MYLYKTIIKKELSSKELEDFFERCHLRLVISKKGNLDIEMTETGFANYYGCDGDKSKDYALLRYHNMCWIQTGIGSTIILFINFLILS